MARIAILTASLAYLNHTCSKFGSAVPAVPTWRISGSTDSTGSTDGSGSSTREEDRRASCTTKVLLANDKTFFSYGMDTPGNVVC